MELKFVADQNVGKLAKLLRIMGFDTLFFDGEDDANIIAIALAESRIILTRDTQIIKRRVVTSGKLKAVLIESDKPEQQVHQLINTLNLDLQSKPFTLCLECNKLLLEKSKEEVKERVPPYVFKTQSQFMECPECHRIYWRGTHRQAMTERLKRFARKGG